MRHNVATHGYGGYSAGCRCDVCRTAKRLYMRDKRAKATARRKQAEGLTFIAVGITHGTYAGYTDAQCRCHMCKDAKADSDRRGRTNANGNTGV